VTEPPGTDEGEFDTTLPHGGTERGGGLWLEKRGNKRGARGPVREDSHEEVAIGSAENKMRTSRRQATSTGVPPDAA
jgi:hypothetical protein